MRYRISPPRSQTGGQLLLLLLLPLMVIGAFLLACGTVAPQDTAGDLTSRFLADLPGVDTATAMPTLPPPTVCINVGPSCPNVCWDQAYTWLH